jgi:hypothetical protein
MGTFPFDQAAAAHHFIQDLFVGPSCHPEKARRPNRPVEIKRLHKGTYFSSGSLSSA